MRFVKNILAALCLLVSVTAFADEGLWLIQDVKTAIGKDMRSRGLRMPPKAVYDMDSPGAGIADAVVSLGFRYSGSVVSDKGLLLTSGIPATAFIERLGDIGQDLVHDGFWAASFQHEIPVQGEKVYSLKRVFDVTEEMKTYTRQLGDRGAAAERVLKAYREATKMTCFLSYLWEGEKSYVSVYKVYDDVRLVAVPPVSAVMPAGKEGKWDGQSPRCDFALYRLYENGNPVVTRRSLVVSLDGGDKGSFSYAIGFPGLTKRYVSSSESGFLGDVTGPLSSGFAGHRLDILRKWIKEDRGLSFKYSARAARLEESLSREKEASSVTERFSLSQARDAKDRELKAWIDGNTSYAGRWGSLFSDMDEATGRVRETETDIILQNETLADGTFSGSYLLRAASASNLDEATRILFSAIQETDPRVEKELLAYAMSEYFTNLGNYYYNPYQEWIQRRFGYDYAAAAEYLYDKSVLSSASRVQALESVDDLQKDPLVKFLSINPRMSPGSAPEYRENAGKLSRSRQEYLRATYLKGISSDEAMYPDADGTMRLSYGNLDGSYTTPESLVADTGIRWRNAIEKDSWGRWGFTVGHKRHKMMATFVTGCDFSEGMEGSPVLDSEGRLVGIVSGGTKEAVASREAYFEGATGCVCTDIHFIIWCLDKYAGMKRIIKEFEID